MVEILTPCIRKCRLENDECVSCGRTLAQIRDWGNMSNSERIDIMKSLQKRNNTHNCPNCGDMTYCAIEDEEPAISCWCMEVRRGEGSGIIYQSECLCRTCLCND